MPRSSLDAVLKFHDNPKLIAENAPLDMLRIPQADQVAYIDELKKAGVVSVLNRGLNGEYHGVRITPAGALALVQWQEFMNERSWSGTVSQLAGRLGWAIAGALLSQIGDLLAFLGA